MDATGVCLILTLAFASSRGHAIEKSCRCGDVTELPCAASPEPGVLYRSVRWYKVDSENQLSGLVRRRMTPQNSTVEYFQGQIQHVGFVSENSTDLVMSNVTPRDSGRYICFLAAPLGHRNQEGIILLRVDGCRNKEFEELVCAIVLLLVSLVILTISYRFLKNVLRNNKKKLIKESLWKISHQQGNIIYVLGKNGLKAVESVQV